jgi:hypothetical protein
MNKVAKLVFVCAFAMSFSSCINQNEDSTRRFCDNKKELLQTYSADTAVWDLTLPVNSFFLNIQKQTGIDSCDGSQNIYLQVELPEYGETFIPARVGNPYCKCCVDVPAGRVRKLKISITNKNKMLFMGNPLKQKFLGEQLVYEGANLFVGNHHAIYQLDWSDEVAANQKLALLQTIITSFFDSMEENYTVDNQGLCNLTSVSEIPRFILMIEKEAVPPPPPPIPDSIKEYGSLH